MNMSQLGIPIEKHSFEERNCIKHLVRGRRSLNLSEEESHRDSCSQDIAGLKNSIPYVNEIEVKRAYHLSSWINLLGPF